MVSWGWAQGATHGIWKSCAESNADTHELTGVNEAKWLKQLLQCPVGMMQSPVGMMQCHTCFPGFPLTITFLPASLLWRFINALLEEAPLLLSRTSTKDCEKATP